MAGRYDAFELALQRDHVQSQCNMLVRRHAPETIFLLKALAEGHAEAVLQAKQGRLQRAQSQLSGLATITLPDDDELRAVCCSTAAPAQALVHWLSGRDGAALACLDEALQACHRLAAAHGHDYLSARRVHLAANQARVLAQAGRRDEALQRVAALRRVVAGDARAWPLADAASLRLPLSGPACMGLRRQLDHIAALATGQPAAANATGSR